MTVSFWKLDIISYGLDYSIGLRSTDICDAILLQMIGRAYSLLNIHMRPVLFKIQGIANGIARFEISQISLESQRGGLS